MLVAWGASLSSLAGPEQKLEINKDGSLTVERHTLSAEELYRLSVANLSELTL